jgi:hypothetical protein
MHVVPYGIGAVYPLIKLSNSTTESKEEKVTGEPWLAGLTLKTVLNWDFYWNKCTLYIKIQTSLKHYYVCSTLFTEMTQSV